MAGLIDAPWTFECSGVSPDVTQQFGPTFKDCADDGQHSLSNLCIGGIKDQHACSVGTCNVIDWNGAVAAPCASNIIHFVTSQAPGMATPCCNSDDCTIPSGKYACDASRMLQLCVVDATAAQCVEPISNTICSGNFSVAVAPPSGSTGNTVSPTFPTNGPNTVTHGFPGTTATDGLVASHESHKWTQQHSRRLRRPLRSLEHEDHCDRSYFGANFDSRSGCVSKMPIYKTEDRQVLLTFLGFR
ncbi:hypothetical protein B0H19DRAFT_1270512 [Mycena capillaripes]|nr:hypothetical protein B0H19DRAFT_1270512 [Mycena capillaripes]